MRQICFYLLISLMVFAFSNAALSQFGDPVPRYPQEMDGMVNMITRKAILSETDLAVPGRGLGLNFTRFGNSGGVYRGIGILSTPCTFGGYWSHTYLWTMTGSPTTIAIVTGNGSRKLFNVTCRNNRWYFLQGRNMNWHKHWTKYPLTITPRSGVKATLKLEQTGTKWAFVYTTPNGTRYKLEPLEDLVYRPWIISKDYVLTEITEPNGNKIKLHYEARPENVYFAKPRLVAVEDSLGRILKFHYGLRLNNRDYPRYITKVEFGLGTKTALTTVYNTVEYTYAYKTYRNGYHWTQPSSSFSVVLLTAATTKLGTGDPRGSEIKTKYEYDKTPKRKNRVYLSAIVAPEGGRTEFDVDTNYHNIEKVRVEKAPKSDGTDGDVLYDRRYGRRYSKNYAYTRGGNTTSDRRRWFNYVVRGGTVATQYEALNFTSWGYYNGNLIYNKHHDYYYKSQNGRPLPWHLSDNWKWYWQWQFKIYYEGANTKHNRQMGNPTKWEQLKTGRSRGSTTVVRTWTADYETKFNRPIWQIDPMGH